jgi:hypothetical protein
MSAIDRRDGTMSEDKAAAQRAAEAARRAEEAARRAEEAARQAREAALNAKQIEARAKDKPKPDTTTSSTGPKKQDDNK